MWLKLKINFDNRCLELLIAGTFSLNVTVLNVRDEIESLYPLIVFLSIFLNILENNSKGNIPL